MSKTTALVIIMIILGVICIITPLYCVSRCRGMWRSTLEVGRHF